MIIPFLSWIGGYGLKSIGEELSRAYERKLQALNEHERLEAEQTITLLQCRRDIILAEQSRVMTSWIRPAFAFPFVAYNFKLIIWDKILKLGYTDELSPNLWTLQMIVFGAYFLTRAVEKH